MMSSTVEVPLDESTRFTPVVDARGGGSSSSQRRDSGVGRLGYSTQSVRVFLCSIAVVFLAMLITIIVLGVKLSNANSKSDGPATTDPDQVSITFIHVNGMVFSYELYRTGQKNP